MQNKTTKNVLLSGASKGLGLCICGKLLKSGYRVYAISRTLSGHLSELGEAYKGRLFFKEVDLSDPIGAANTVFKGDFIPRAFPLDAFVSNAAQSYEDIVSNIDEAKLEGMFKVNVFSPMLLTKYAIRNMLLNRRPGSIVHISSICAHTGYKGLSMYAATKGAIESFSIGTAREWGRRGIRSNTVSPGFMEIGMATSLSDEDADKIRRRNSLKKAADPESVADTVAFLISDGASSITGQNVCVDCGSL